MAYSYVSVTLHAENDSVRVSIMLVGHSDTSRTDTQRRLLFLVNALMPSTDIVDRDSLYSHSVPESLQTSITEYRNCILDLNMKLKQKEKFTAGFTERTTFPIFEKQLHSRKID